MNTAEDTLLNAADALIIPAIVLGPAIPAWIYAALAWSGRHRSWATKPVFRMSGITPAFMFHKYNYWPLLSGVIGTAWVLLWIEAWLEGAPEIWEPVMWGALVMLVVLGNWWPQWRTPKWHKDWIARGGGERPDVPLWNPDQDISRRLALRRHARKAAP